MIDEQMAKFGDIEIPVYTLNTVIVGTGAAGLNCACHLFREFEETGVENPQQQLAIVTRGVGLGTSNNSGSDKQTYYKLGTDAVEADCPTEFSKTLTAGGCAHEDHALIEGENSLRCFYHLVDAGVPFPSTPRGSFVGYKTDHDPRQRATSAGPWTSRYMVQKLLAESKRYGIRIFDKYHVTAIVKDPDSGCACGLLCVRTNDQQSSNRGLTLFNCRNIVVAGGGPGELYEISVYPKGQMGPYAALFEAGAEASNLTESQFGLASLNPRWNLSGTYQQVIPRYFSTDQNSGDVREFLNPWFDSMSTLATDIFLKGYQWPFDHDKIADYGSSLVDVLVQNEMINKGRKVYMDFTQNPVATDDLEQFDLEQLGPEALTYLKKSGALQATPILRLAHMNQPSIDLYKQMGVDLCNDPLEIGVCSQHCNGGFAVDEWWESSVPNLFVVGELAGTHGVKRPGGSALNAGQVGSLRAAQRIAHIYFQQPMDRERFKTIGMDSVSGTIARLEQHTSSESAPSAEKVKTEIQRRMSQYAGMVRSLEGIRKALDSAWAQWQQISQHGLRQLKPGFLLTLEVRELALAQLGFLEAIRAVLEKGGGSRGSHLVAHTEGHLPHPKLGDEWKYIPENLELKKEILQIQYDSVSDAFIVKSEQPRSVSTNEFWFENTWTEYRNGTIFTKDKNEKPRPYKL